MKKSPLYLTFSLLFWIPFPFALNGCATLGTLEGDTAPSEVEASEAAEQSDPIVEVARRYRTTSTTEEQLRREQQRAIAHSTGEIALGLSMDDVFSLWGEPREIIPAGTPGMGYEKWVYYEGLSSPWSVSTARVVYFEKGEVVGWQTARP